MLGKAIITIIVVAIAGYAMKRIQKMPRSSPVPRKPVPGSEGEVAKLRKDPKTGEYIPADD